MSHRQTTNVSHEPTTSHELFAPPPTNHLGWQALLEAHRLLEIDDAGTAWHADGFTWRAAPTVAERPLEAIDPIQDVRAGRSGEDMDVMD